MIRFRLLFVLLGVQRFRYILEILHGFLEFDAIPEKTAARGLIGGCADSGWREPVVIAIQHGPIDFCNFTSFFAAVPATLANTPWQYALTWDAVVGFLRRLAKLPSAAPSARTGPAGGIVAAVLSGIVAVRSNTRN